MFRGTVEAEELDWAVYAVERRVPFDGLAEAVRGGSRWRPVSLFLPGMAVI